MCGCGDLKYSPRIHSHGDLYYRKSEVLALLSQYYLKSEVDALLSNLQAQIDACCQGEGFQPTNYNWDFGTGSNGWADDQGAGLTFTPIGAILGADLASFGGNAYAHLSSNLVDFDGSLTVWADCTIDWSQSAVDSYAFAKYDYGSGERSWRLGTKPDGNVRFVVSPDGGYNFDLNAATGTSVIPTGLFTKICGVFDATAQEMRVFVNGVKETTKAVGFDQVYISTAPLTVGADMQNGSPVQYMTGTIDEVKIFNYALTDAQVAAL